MFRRFKRVGWGLLLVEWLGLATATSRVAAATDVRRDATVEAIERVLPSVVNISTKTRVERRGYYYDWWRDNWAPYSQQLPPRESAGSGVIIDESGYVLTNVHVVEEADEISVHISGEDGKPEQTYRADPVIGSVKTDIALLRLRAKPGEKFRAARFAADDDLLLGETVIALGNPFGLGGSVSRGILSSKTRRADSGSEALDFADWLQTDASINPGNSGGPLINLKGEVIGISVAILKQGQGIGFAIPAKRISEALSEIYTPEELRQLWFGARVKAGRLPLAVEEVQAGSPAAAAGLKAGDSILKIGDRAPRSFIDFVGELVSGGEKKPVQLTVQRGAEQRVATVRLVPEKQFFNADLIRQRTGLSVQPLTEALAEQLGLAEAGGLVIGGVDDRSPAASAKLQVGMVIVSIDGVRATDVVNVAKQVQARKRGAKVTLELIVESRRGAFVRRGTYQAELILR